ncbi:hypothetical protein [Halomarina rubra]|uniref:Uncharacterized protein n=1 Tax=Halomarina rubra TaxID=2071873 RepID=A0ABD6AUT4_9EURY|nr:hypothetical protein [Halomarina rubra]
MRQGALTERAESLVVALTFPLTTTPRTVVAAGVAGVTYCLLVLSSFPEYSVQLLSADIGYLDEALVALTANTVATAGTTGVALIVAYSLLAGIAMVNAVTQVRVVGLRGAGSLSGAVPGLLASGCASCGAGVLGLLGLAGALATLPFHGNLLRLGGLVLLLAFLGRAGDPRVCNIETQ